MAVSSGGKDEPRAWKRLDLLKDAMEFIPPCRSSRLLARILLVQYLFRPVLVPVPSVLGFMSLGEMLGSDWVVTG